MFAGVARRMGYRVAVWDPDPDAPAHHLADDVFVSPFSDPETREKFAHTVDAVTFEWENVPAELCEWLERCHRVRPSGAVLRIIQDRIKQKEFLQASGLPVSTFLAIESPDHLAETVQRVGLPAVCKTATSGYDGKGQWLIRRHSDVEPVAQAMRGAAGQGSRWILEQFVEFEREVSVLVVRGENGECQIFPVVENVHEGGILRMTQAPSSLPSAMAGRATDLAGKAVSVLNGIGVFCVEFFHTPDNLFINEIAPRPHNSGHYTLDACTVSQFEQQVRVLCGLPLGEIRQFSPAAMVNLIGEEVRVVTSGRGYKDLMSLPGAVLHLYGKRVVRPGRKMGHVTFLAERSEEAVERAQWLMQRLATG
jgi:5-(carboxyamino)imidazole ribonucleotide synthase